MLLILPLIGACIVFGPGLWVSYVLKKYNRQPESNFPGTGGELARHLLDRCNLQDVKVVVTEIGDHYSPDDRSVALTKDKFDGKTLASIVIAAHECGHAIQHANREPLFVAAPIGSVSSQRAGHWISVVGSESHCWCFDHVASFELRVIFRGLFSSRIRCRRATSNPASRIGCELQKGAAILGAGYISNAQLGPSKIILRAAALTYVAGTLMQLLNFWRWIAVLRR